MKNKTEATISLLALTVGAFAGGYLAGGIVEQEATLRCLERQKQLQAQMSSVLSELLGDSP